MNHLRSVVKIISSTPPPWVLWLTTLAAAAAVIRLIWDIWHDFKRGRNERKREIRLREDLFWFQQVILPDCVNALQRFKSSVLPLADKLQDSIDKGETAENLNNQYQNYQQQFLSIKQHLLTEIIVLNLADDGKYRSDAYQECATIIDQLEDDISSYVVTKAVKSLNHKIINGQNIKRLCEGGYIDLLRAIKKCHSQRFVY